jgi:hypothetical protein
MNAKPNRPAERGTVPTPDCLPDGARYHRWFYSEAVAEPQCTVGPINLPRHPSGFPALGHLQCGGQQHAIWIGRRGAIALRDHPHADVELVLAAAGGRTSPCLDVLKVFQLMKQQDIVTGRDLPEGLRTGFLGALLRSIVRRDRALQPHSDSLQVGFMAHLGSQITTTIREALLCCEYPPCLITPGGGRCWAPPRKGPGLACTAHDPPATRSAHWAELLNAHLQVTVGAPRGPSMAIVWANDAYPAAGVEFRVSVRPRWIHLKARGLSVLDRQLVLDIVENGPVPTVLVGRAIHRGMYPWAPRCEVRPQLARALPGGHVHWLPSNGVLTSA